MTEGQKIWELIEALELPRPLTSLRAVTITNIVYVTGETNRSYIMMHSNKYRR